MSVLWSGFPRDFKLFVRGYGASLRCSGRLGWRPDTALVDSQEGCHRVGLPKALPHMTFEHVRMPASLGRHEQELVQNFYHRGEYLARISQTTIGAGPS